MPEIYFKENIEVKIRGTIHKGVSLQTIQFIEVALYVKQLTSVLCSVNTTYKSKHNQNNFKTRLFDNDKY